MYTQFKRILEASEKDDNSPIDEQIQKLTSDSRKAFVDAMDDDFNTPRGLATLIAFARDTEPYGSKQLGRSSIELIVQTFGYFGGVFGILQSAGTQQSSVTEGLVDMVLELRSEARKKGDWQSGQDSESTCETWNYT